MIDRGENITLMEPLLISEAVSNRIELMDLVIDVAQKSAQFKSSLPSPYPKLPLKSCTSDELLLQ